MGVFLPLDMDERCNRPSCSRCSLSCDDFDAIRDFVGQASMAILMFTLVMSPQQERCWSMRQYMSSFYLNQTILNYMYLNFRTF